MDPRYKEDSIFYRRRLEWSKDNIKRYISDLFVNVDILDGWSLVSCDWATPQKSKRSEELKKHITSTLKVIVRDPADRDIVYNIKIPELVNEQFFYIGGHLKIPIFQLYDYPIIFRNSLLRLRTNTITISFDLGRSDHKINIFNKLLPIEELITAVHTREEMTEFLSDKEVKDETLAEIVELCYDIWDNTDQDDRILQVGSYFSNVNTDEMKKGCGVVFSLGAAYKIDFFSQPFFKTNSLLFELLNALNEGKKSDTDIKRKRVRFAEYVLAPLTRKVYDMLLTLFNSRKVKFQIPQNIIIDNCNVSEIIHYNFPINPASEVASMCQLSLTGPGGFKKNNVPSFLRDLDPSQFGCICGADTPDREGCGVILNMVPTVRLDELGNFEDPNEEVITSYTISNVPFMEHDDQTRLQMSSNQTKQSILLKESEKPFIRSGIEDCYLHHSTFLHKAKDDGIVTHLDNKYMIVSYKDKTSDIFKISYRSLYLGAIDKLIPCFNEGDTFHKDDILCESSMIKDGELSLGRNLLTGVAIWKGFNYEDGIIISEAVSNNKFTSVHSVEITFTIESGQVLLSLEDDSYSPVPKVGSFLKKGDICAKIKTLDGEDGFESINIEPFEVIAPLDCEVTDIEIYPNSWNKKVKEFNDFIEVMSIKQTDGYVVLYNKLLQCMNKEDADRFVTMNGLSRLDCIARAGKYTSKGRRFGGVIIKIQAIYEEKIGIGDKIANRHGHKGVIAKKVPENMMPRLPDGRRLEIIINPLGIISRMNVGQLYELHLNEALYQLKNELRDNCEDNETKIEKLKGFLDIVDKTPDKWVTTKILNEYMLGLERDERENTHGKAEIELYIIQPPFQSIGPEDLFDVMVYTSAHLKYNVFDPANSMDLRNFIAVGYLYFSKLIHRSSDKISARSIGPYSKKTLQPLGGKSRLGGHRLGEMETWSLIAHGAEDLLTDFLTLQSDSAGLKNKFLAEVLQNPELAASNSSDNKPQSLRLFEAYLKTIGLKIES